MRPRSQFWRRSNVRASSLKPYLAINTSFIRYNPAHELVKRSRTDGKVGRVLSVHSGCLLDAIHVADQSRYCHHPKESSGSLMVHKPGHHYDPVNRCLATRPVTDTGLTRFAFYGDKTGKEHGISHLGLVSGRHDTAYCLPPKMVFWITDLNVSNIANRLGYGSAKAGNDRATWIAYSYTRSSIPSGIFKTADIWLYT
ncbi:hypothetical protein BDV93DRAFT_606637 [Ceratobasidium sp. AG-I]|nr:hypothetical protein BDV93DRAFT_606637 [Ceratobasidium sp. AG-I]